MAHGAEEQAVPDAAFYFPCAFTSQRLFIELVVMRPEGMHAQGIEAFANERFKACVPQSVLLCQMTAE